MQANSEIEIWKDIPQYEGLYKISSLGRVKTLLRTVKVGSHFGIKVLPEKILVPGKSAGYYKVELCLNGIQKSHKIHSLVAKSFIENPENKKCINHIDGNKENNNIKNLEWVTSSENLIHAIGMGLNKPVVFKGKRSLENRLKISNQRKEYFKNKKNG